MRTTGGGIMAAPLAIAAPETGGGRDREAVPAPLTYSLQISTAADVRAVRVTRETVRRGRKIGFSRSVVTDDNPERLIALTSGTGVTLATHHQGLRRVTFLPISRTHHYRRSTWSLALVVTLRGGDSQSSQPGWPQLLLHSTSGPSTWYVRQPPPRSQQQLRKALLRESSGAAGWSPDRVAG